MSKFTKLAALVNRRHILFHPLRTGRFLGALMRDTRVPAVNKIMFVLLITAFLLVMLFPDALEETVLSTVLPVLGSILGIPITIGMDWGTFAILSIYLLRVFPIEVVNEHYARLVLDSKFASDRLPPLDVRLTD